MTIQRRLFHVYISTKSIQSHFRLISYNVIFLKEKSGNGQRRKPTRSVFPLYLINYICKFCIFHFTIFMFGEINTLELYPSTKGEYCKICIRTYPENSKSFQALYNVDTIIAVHFLSSHVG